MLPLDTCFHLGKIILFLFAAGILFFRHQFVITAKLHMKGGPCILIWRMWTIHVRTGMYFGKPKSVSFR